MSLPRTSALTNEELATGKYSSAISVDWMQSNGAQLVNSENRGKSLIGKSGSFDIKSILDE